MEKRTVKFYSESVRLESDLYLPSDLKAGERRPGIVLCHGFTGLRALILGDYAKVFVDAGFVAFTFDYRGFGGSEGEKWRLIPLEQIDDIRNAISFFEAQPQVDPERIGLWGTSFGGANAPYAAASSRQADLRLILRAFGADGWRPSPRASPTPNAAICAVVDRKSLAQWDRTCRPANPCDRASEYWRNALA